MSESIPQFELPRGSKWGGWCYEFNVKMQRSAKYIKWFYPWHYTTGPIPPHGMYGSREQRDVLGLIVAPFVFTLIRWRLLLVDEEAKSA